MVKKMLIWFSVFLNITFFVITLFAIVHHNSMADEKKHHGMKQITSEIFSQLNLTPDQKTEIDTLVDVHIKEMDAVNELIDRQKIDFFKRMGEETGIDDDVIDRDFISIHKLKEKRGKIILKHLKDIRNELSREQCRLFFNKLAEHKIRRYADANKRDMNR